MTAKFNAAIVHKQFEYETSIGIDACMPCLNTSSIGLKLLINN